MATIRKRAGKFQVQVRRQGCPALSKTFHSLQDARLWARQMEIKVDRKELHSDPKALERVTLADLVIRYRETVTPRKRGHEVERIVLTAFLRHPICMKRISDLSSADFALYRDERLKRVQPNSLRREFAPLHNLFETAKDEWGLPLRDNPLTRVRIESPCNRRQRRLKDGELERIELAGKKTNNPYILPVIHIALETGLRRSEILSATVGDLNLENRLLAIPKPKNGHSRVIPLSSVACDIFGRLRDWISNCPQSHERLFPITPNALRLSWDRLLRRAEIDDLHFHDLRHEAISRLFELGLTMPEVALISGHRDPRMLFRYGHAQYRRILEQFDNENLRIPRR